MAKRKSSVPAGGPSSRTLRNIASAAAVLIILGIEKDSDRTVLRTAARLGVDLRSYPKNVREWTYRRTFAIVMKRQQRKVITPLDIQEERMTYLNENRV